MLFFTARRVAQRGYTMVSCLSVCLSVTLVDCELWSHALKFFENNFAAATRIWISSLREVFDIWRVWCFVIVQSDLLCGLLHCDISAVTDLLPDNYRTPWTQYENRTFYFLTGATRVCRFAEYHTFYSGPDRPDPGLVPDGAFCGTGKVGLSVFQIFT